MKRQLINRAIQPAGYERSERPIDKQSMIAIEATPSASSASSAPITVTRPHKKVRRPITVTHQTKVLFYDYLKNCIQPEQLTRNSSDEVYWCCPDNEEHSWIEKVNRFVSRKSNCLLCVAEEFPSKHSFAAKYPELLAQWHKTKNGEINPALICPTSLERVWWQCNQASDHVWQALVVNRVMKGSGCPYCAGRKVPHSASLAVKKPGLAKHWHPSKNGDLTPFDVGISSRLKVWWRCPVFPIEEHDWQATVGNLSVNIYACPKCMHLRPGRPDSLKKRYPELAEQWHPSLNRPITPNMVATTLHTSYYWMCPNNTEHVWSTSIQNRVKAKSGCPYCSGNRATSERNLLLLFPDVAKQWDKEKNGELTARDVRPYSSQVVWWQCSVSADHSWKTAVYIRTKTNQNRVKAKSGCPYCARKRATSERNLLILFPDVAKQWDKEKNGELTAKDVLPYSEQIVWWQCPVVVEHNWKMAVYSRTRSNSGCPFCVKSAFPGGQSFAAKCPQLLQQWHKTKNRDVDPAQISSSSLQTVWWQCENGREHVWQASVSSRVCQGKGCPYCAGKSVLASSSLAVERPEIAKYWHPTKNGDFTPYQVGPNSLRRVWWRCSVVQTEDHDWKGSIVKRTASTSPSACPKCKSSIENFSVANEETILNCPDNNFRK